MRLQVKICGLTNYDDAALAVSLGADYLGFIFAPSPRRITPDDAAEIIEKLSRHDKRFDSIERALNSLRMDIAALSDMGVDHRSDIEALRERVSRIEKRLELDETFPSEGH